MFAITAALGEADVTATMRPLFLKNPVNFHGDFGSYLGTQYTSFDTRVSPWHTSSLLMTT